MNATMATKENWSELIKAMGSGEIFETDVEGFDYFLEVLPPVYMGKVVTLPNGEKVKAAFGFAEGAEEIVAFWKKGGRYFGCRTTQINPCW